MGYRLHVTHYTYHARSMAWPTLMHCSSLPPARGDHGTIVVDGSRVVAVRGSWCALVEQKTLTIQVDGFVYGPLVIYIVPIVA